MATVERVNGTVGTHGVLNGKAGAQVGASLKFYVVDAGADLTAEAGVGRALDAMLRVVPNGILAYHSVGTAGVVHLIVDGVNAPDAATLQATIRSIGTFDPTGTPYVFTGATVTEGTSFVVA